MSADNGIYILQSPVANSDAIEYRVAYASAIDNVGYYEEGSPSCIAMENAYFGDSEVYLSADAALSRARQLEKEYTDNLGYLEYGIKVLTLRNLPFEVMPPDIVRTTLGW